jgi:hypothetical protein
MLCIELKFVGPACMSSRKKGLSDVVMQFNKHNNVPLQLNVGHTATFPRYKPFLYYLFLLILLTQFAVTSRAVFLFNTTSFLLILRVIKSQGSYI